jgi:hypothetical protein
MAQGTIGKIRAFNDFTAFDATTVNATSMQLGGGVGLIGVNEGSIASTIDEPGGILAITTDTADDDNHFLVAGPFRPCDGGMYMEARFKLADVGAADACVAVGFSETMVEATPVVPAEYATTTLTVNGTGGMALLLFDSDGTALDWRPVIADAGAVLAGTNCDGTALGATITADRWYVARVEITPDGYASVYFGDATDAADLKRVAYNTAALDNDVCYTAFLAIENRAGGAEVLEVDYFLAEGYRDWSVA